MRTNDNAEGLDAIVSRALARSVAASRPSSSLQASTSVVVTVHLDSLHRRICVTVADTGQAIASLQGVQTCFHNCADAFGILDGRTLHVQTTAQDEACIRAFALHLCLEGRFQVTECPSLPKSCPKGPFSGSEVAFSLALPEGAAATQRVWDILGLVQEVMEVLIIVAPPIAVQLRVKGFDGQDPIPDMTTLPRKIVYSLEDVPYQATPAERLHAGLQAFYVQSTGTSNEDRNADGPAPGTVPPRIYTSPCVSTTGVADQGSWATVWTACAGIVVIEDASQIAVEPKDLSVSLFENYATLQRPLQPLLKALERVDWASFGIIIQGTAGEGIGAARLTFAPGSEETCHLMRALVVHLVPPVAPASPAKSKRRAPGLSAKTEAKLVKGAVTRALQALKEARPHSLQSGFEQRMACLGDLARSISALVAQSTNADFQEAACSTASTDLHGLRDAIHEGLEAIALNSNHRGRAQRAERLGSATQ